MSGVAGIGLLFLAALPAVMVIANLAQLRPPPAPRRRDQPPSVAVLIPARNEQRVIGAALDAVLASRYPRLEVHVMDDASEDATAEIVQQKALQDPRVHLHQAPALPAGWCGKQHACQALGEATSGDLLLFVDADVELAPQAIDRIVEFMESSGAELVSGFPRQRTGSFLERLLIPLIHFVLLGFLPLWQMRRSRRPGYGAACGQLVAVRRPAYERVGGHGAIRASRHDGVQLPRAFRRAGFHTDLFDATDLAACRMYRNGAEVWRGLAKNATEGMGSPAAIVPWTVILLGGQVAPWAALAAGWFGGASAGALAPAAVACALGYAARALLALRFRQSWLGALCHPLGVLLLVAIQWYALLRETVGRPVAWKGRHA